MVRFTAPWLEQMLGATLVLLVLADVFLTVMYARIGTGIISDYLAQFTWWLFRIVADRLARYKAALLSFCGPTIIVVVITTWALVLTCGTALIIHPALGTSVTSSSGTTPTDFVTAVYVGGSSMSFVGTGEFLPRTSGFRLFYLFTSLIGMSVLSLTLMYLMQIYAALQSRNALALKVHLATAETGDAAELIAGLGPEGRFDAGYTVLAPLALEVTDVEEFHHFYPVLFFFRFLSPAYSMSRLSLVTLDCATLIKSALADEEFAWLKESSSVAQLWRGTLSLLTTLEGAFLPGGLPRPPGRLDAPTQDRWRRRYFAAVRLLKAAGIKTMSDEQAGADVYVSLRAQWHHYVVALAPAMGYSLDEIDVVGSNPEAARAWEQFRARLRSAG